MEMFCKLMCICWVLTLAVTTAGCAADVTDKAYRQDQLIRIDHPAYVAELIKPETADFSKDKARFVEGGWLLSLISKRTGENVFYDRTVIPGHNAYGLPLEFIGAVPLGDNRFLRLGVGIVSREPDKGRFHDQIVERFPWFSEVMTDEDGTTVHFYQFAPRFYFYTRSVRFENDSKKIVFSDDFLNLSDRTIENQAFFHPFFKVLLEAEPWFRFDSEPDFANLENRVLPEKGASFFEVVENPENKAWYVCGAEEPLAALWVENAAEVGFWREKRAKAKTHVFAVEPFVTIKALPWENVRWRWGIEIP